MSASNLQTIFFGELYPSETRKLFERLLNYVVYKVSPLTCYFLRHEERNLLLQAQVHLINGLLSSCTDSLYKFILIIQQLLSQIFLHVICAVQ